MPPSRNDRAARGDQTLGTAHAPYNFVPFPARVVGASLPPSADRYHPDRLTGHIALHIKTESPVYVRGVVAPGESEAKSQPGFFAPGGQPALPGSSLRGMLRSLVEIVSASAVAWVADSHYVYRAVADRRGESRTDLYRGRMQQVQAGYLRRVAGRLQIRPAQRVEGRQYWRVRLDTARDQLHLGQGDISFTRRPVIFQPTAGGDEGRTPLVTAVKPQSGARPDGWSEGYLVISGPMQGKHHAWIVAAPDEHAEPLLVSEPDEQTHREGWSQKLEEVDRAGQFPLLPRENELIPCFYTHWTDEAGREHLAWGHTRWFRVPYEHGVLSRVPTQAGGSGWDMARAIFGRVDGDDAWAGRVFVEDGLLDGAPEAHLLPVALPKILSAPKPTTFQHYLAQERAAETGQLGDLRHWDSPDAAVRGYKRYWHRPGADWKETDSTRPPPGDSQGSPIQPVRAGSVFRGRLRFENLSEIELGALLFVLQLPDGCRHHIGMGKPLGMGSVHITAALHVDDRPARYRRLFGANGAWATPERDDVNADHCRAAFARWLLGKLRPGDRPAPDDAAVEEALWSGPLAPLRAMLTWAGAPDASATAYMDLPRFRDRPLLPDPIAVQRGDDQAGLGGAPVPAGPTSPHAPPPGRPAPPTAGPKPTPPKRPQPPDAPRADEQPGATLEDLVNRFSRQRQAAPPPRSTNRAGDKAKREQQELMDRLRRGDQGGDAPPSRS